MQKKQRIKIIIDEPTLLPADAEKLEDELAQFLMSKQLTGSLTNNITGNTTTFTLVHKIKTEEED